MRQTGAFLGLTHAAGISKSINRPMQSASYYFLNNVGAKDTG